MTQIKEYKCHFSYCTHNEKVKETEAILIKGKPNKRYHKDCYQLYLQSQKDKEDLDKLCKYLSKKYFDNQAVTTSMVRRLQAIRNDVKFIKTGDKIKFKKNEGNNYKIILYTIYYYSEIIFRALKGKNFDDYNKKLGYILAITRDKIPKIKEQIKLKKREKRQLENLGNNLLIKKDKSTNKINNNNKKDKISNNIKDLW